MNKIVSLPQVRGIVSAMLGNVLHNKQVLSLGNAVWGAMHSPRLSITCIGRAYAASAGIFQRCGVKQVDRIVGSRKVSLTDAFAEYAHMVVGARKRVRVSLDWTEYDSTDQSRIAVNLITRHGRATPLVWLTVTKSKMRNRRSSLEKRVLKLLKHSLDDKVDVEVIADRGFCSTELFKYIDKTLRWNYTIRIRSDVTAFEPTHPLGRNVKRMRVVRGARPRKLSGVKLTGKKFHVQSLVLVWDTKMTAPWYLVSSRDCAPEEIVKTYARRFTCEEQFRDEKDDRFGVGSKETAVSTNRRRDMLTLIHALATVILTLIGEVGERLGYDTKLRVNTVKRRTHSLYCQGKAYLDGVHKTYTSLFKETLSLILREHRQCTDMYGVI